MRVFFILFSFSFVYGCKFSNNILIMQIISSKKNDECSSLKYKEVSVVFMICREKYPCFIDKNMKMFG